MEIFDVSPQFLVFGALATLIFGVSKGGFGASFVILGFVLFAQAVPPLEAAAVLLPILLVMDAIGLYVYWGKWDWRLLGWTLVFGLLGVVIASFMITWVSDSALKIAIGITALAFCLQRWIGDEHVSRLFGKGGYLAGGFWSSIAGFTSTIAHSGGPPMVIFLLSRRIDKIGFIAFSVAYFAVINAIKVVPYTLQGLFTTQTLLHSVLLLPLAPFGFWFGIWLRDRIPERAFFTIIAIGLLISGLRLVWLGVAGVAT